MDSLLQSKSLPILLVLFTLATVLFQSHLSSQLSEFDEWKTQHQVTYSSHFENLYRARVFYQNLALVQQHNSRHTETYQIGINQFSDLTDSQFSLRYLSHLKVLEKFQMQVETVSQLQAADIDWTKQGAVAPTKNQGQCAAAWVFSTTGPLQGLSKIADGTLKILSDQQLIDCASRAGAGCSGGLASTGFKWVQDHGIATADKYPYVGRQETCKMSSGEFKIAGFTSINECNGLSNEIHKGPVSVLVDASNWSRYMSGIFTNCATNVNHAVNLVGETQEYWKVQNSWGASWGENGFIRLGKGNTCGICMYGIRPYK